MKTFLIILLVLVVLAGGGLLWMSAHLSPDVALGTSSPDLALTTLDGGSLPLADLRGKIVLLDFWGST